MAIFDWFKNRDQEAARLDWLASHQYVLLQIQVPRSNDKTPLAAEQMFASLHGIFQSGAEFQEHLGFEIVAKGSSIQFYVFCPVHLRDFVEGQIYAQYPTIEITKVKDYTKEVDLKESHTVSCELEMNKEDVYPIKTFANFTVDPLAGITAPLAKLSGKEEVWIQLLISPVEDTWQARGNKLIDRVKKGLDKPKPTLVNEVVSGVATIAKDVVREAATPGAILSGLDNGKKVGAVELPKLSGTVESALKGVEEKITKLGFATKVRIMAVADDVYEAQSKVMGVVGSFKQFNTTNLNGFSASKLVADSQSAWENYSARFLSSPTYVLNIEEVASIFHLPNIAVETPNIVWSKSKKGEPPADLPIIGVVPSDQITRMGWTNFRNLRQEFGIRASDRRRHMYVIGKSGTGKSTLLENMAIDDIDAGRGVVVVDPHGEFYEHVLENIPRNRLNDVVLFDPADRYHPVGFNLLEAVDDDLKGIVASGFVGIFEKMFSNSWGPRLEHILRNTVLALLDCPGSTMMGIPKMLTDKKFRQEVVSKVKDPVIKDFWEGEFASWDNKFASEAVAPILNKVGQFLATPTIRNIVAQPKSTFDIRQLMDQGKILLINLSRGRIGEDNSAMLGAMMITKIQMAAMSRADVIESQRTDSYLYVDEFQNFATKSFATILSEARKYHLNLVMANQYISQMPDEVKDAVFGNVGTIITFRVGAADASELVKEFTPVFTEVDLVNQDIHKILVKLSINGLTGNAFSADTLPPVTPDISYTAEIIQMSREKYSLSRDEVEKMVGRVDDTAVATPHPEEGIILPPLKINSDNIIEDRHYRELYAKGGNRWWEGQPLDQLVSDEEEKRKKFISKKLEQLKQKNELGQGSVQISRQSENNPQLTGRPEIKNTLPNPSVDHNLINPQPAMAQIPLEEGTAGHV